MHDARESRDFQKRILEEERERQKILDNIEERRRAQEAARKLLLDQLAAKKSIQDNEIDDMLKTNKER